MFARLSVLTFFLASSRVRVFQNLTRTSSVNSAGLTAACFAKPLRSSCVQGCHALDFLPFQHVSIDLLVCAFLAQSSCPFSPLSALPNLIRRSLALEGLRPPSCPCPRSHPAHSTFVRSKSIGPCLVHSATRARVPSGLHSFWTREPQVL